MTFPKCLPIRAVLSLALASWAIFVHAAPQPPPSLSLTISNNQAQAVWTPYPAVDQYRIWYKSAVEQPFQLATNGSLSGYQWTAPRISSAGFYGLDAITLSSNALLNAHLLNRLAYGPTPDDLDRITAIGPQAYINEQMSPENITETLDNVDTSGTNWIYVTFTGTVPSSTFYIYLNGAGDCYVDDLKLVVGSTAGVGANLLANGDFEGSISPWLVTSNFANSTVVTGFAHSGNSSLHVVATAAGAGSGNSIYQTITPSLSTTQTFTLSYWYLPSSNRTLTVRASNASTAVGIFSAPDSLLPAISRRLKNTAGSIGDMRAWYTIHATRARRQLFEVLTQFIDNHFTTQYSKNLDYFGGLYSDSTTEGNLAASLDYREINRWRDALLKPDCTFSNLLTISAESPSMIIYLDTVNSKGNGSNIANENYARELMELFTFGVDNGYDQTDITTMSRAWTGWSLNFVDATNVFNPFALKSTNNIPGTIDNFGAYSNLVGIWAFSFKSASHNTNSKTIFPGKTVPARFGPPWAGRSYQLALPSRKDTAGIQDGYDVIAHLSNQPFTEEFISVKLCRLFVHDDFAIGYDFTDPNLSDEGRLVHDCMLAWENSTPKGQLRPILNTIFNSDLFRSHGAVSQKVKTPLEFVVSAVRALRSENTNGPATADTDGFSYATAMGRMGSMNLFDRVEPDGYPETAPAWVSAGTLAERLRFVQALMMAPGQSGRTDAGDGNRNDPVALVKMRLPQPLWNSAGDVADMFIALLYPAEGRANLDLYRTQAMNYLNTADNGTTASLFSTLSMTGSPSPYDTRVRGMVAMLLTFPRFEEQ